MYRAWVELPDGPFAEKLAAFEQEYAERAKVLGPRFREVDGEGLRAILQEPTVRVAMTKAMTGARTTIALAIATELRQQAGVVQAELTRLLTAAEALEADAGDTS